MRVAFGGVATLVGCRLANGGLGKALHGSTAILVHCEIEVTPGEAWQVDRGSHLALIDCRSSEPIDVDVESGASITVNGADVTELWGSDGRRRLRVASRQ